MVERVGVVLASKYMKNVWRRERDVPAENR